MLIRNMLLVLSLPLFSFLSCVSAQTNNKDAWIAAPFEDLKNHPLFSQMPHSNKKVGDDELWVYQNFQSTTKCTTEIGFFIDDNTCKSQTSTCMHKFLVQDNVVQSYTVIGQGCVIDCTYRPASNPCVNTPK